MTTWQGRQLCCYSGQTTGGTTQDTQHNLQQEQEIHFRILSTLCLWPNHPHIQWVPVPVSLTVSQLWQETDHSSQSDTCLRVKLYCTYPFMYTTRYSDCITIYKMKRRSYWEEEASWNVMAQVQKPDFVFQWNGRVHLNQRGVSLESNTGSRGVRMSDRNVGYTMFWGSVEGNGYPLQSPVSPSLPLPCITLCHHISTGLYYQKKRKEKRNKNTPPQKECLPNKLS